jgi:hypothetical protein
MLNWKLFCISQISNYVVYAYQPAAQWTFSLQSISPISDICKVAYRLYCTDTNQSTNYNSAVIF